MSGPLEFPYHVRGKIAFGIAALFVAELVCLAGLGYMFATGNLTLRELLIAPPGSALPWRNMPVALAFGVVCIVLIPMLFFGMRRSVVRLTDSELSVGSIRGPRTLPIREIGKIRILGEGKSRGLVIEGVAGRDGVYISEDMLPSTEAFNQVHQALLSRRP